MTSNRRTLRRHKLAMIAALERGMHDRRAPDGDPRAAARRASRVDALAAGCRAAGWGLAEGAAWIATAALGAADVAVDEAGDVVRRAVWEWESPRPDGGDRRVDDPWALRRDLWGRDRLTSQRPGKARITSTRRVEQ